MKELSEKVIDSQRIKILVDYLAKEANGKHTEFRVVIKEDGTGYAHAMGRNCESLNFQLPKFFQSTNSK